MGHVSSVAQMTQLVSPSRPEVVTQMAVARLVCRPDAGDRQTLCTYSLIFNVCDSLWWNLTTVNIYLCSDCSKHDYHVLTVEVENIWLRICSISHILTASMSFNIFYLKENSCCVQDDWSWSCNGVSRWICVVCYDIVQWRNCGKHNAFWGHDGSANACRSNGCTDSDDDICKLLHCSWL